MRFEIGRHSIRIAPDCPEDEAYLEEVLGLKANGSQAECSRVNAVNLSCWAFLEIKKTPTRTEYEASR